MFIVNLAAGALTVAAISLSPLYARRVRLARSARLGVTLVVLAIALGAASVASTDGLPPKDGLFLCLFAMLLLGSLLILADPGDGPDDDDERGPDGEPPWWPEFEDGFRRYARRTRVPVGR